MFTWLQSITRKYGKWMFLLLLAPVIVAFVFTVTPGRSGLKSGMSVRELDYFGYNLASEVDMQKIYRGAEISAWIQSGRRPYKKEMIEDLAFNRIAFLALADDLSVPGPNEKQVREYLTSRRSFMDENGKFNEEIYLIFKNVVQADSGFSEERVAQILAEDYRIDKVQEAIIGPGYIQPFEALKHIELLNTLWTVNVATLNYASYKPFILIDEGKLKDFYEKSKFRYEVPRRIKVSPIIFSLSNFLDEVESPEESELESFYDRQKWRFNNNEEKNDEGNDKELTYLDVKDKVREAYLQEIAGRMTAESADEFTFRLYRDKIERYSDLFNELVKSKKGFKADLKLYAKSEPPTDTKIPRQALINAFSLDENRYFSDIIKTSDGTAVLIFEKYIDAYIPTFEEVRESVLDSYEETERKRMFMENGKTLNTVFSDALLKGRLFSDIAEEQGLSIDIFENFTRREPPEGFNISLFSQIENLSPGEISPMVFLDEKGVFVSLQAKKNPEANNELTNLNTTIEQIVSATNFYNGQSLIFEIRSNELEKSQAL